MVYQSFIRLTRATQRKIKELLKLVSTIVIAGLENRLTLAQGEWRNFIFDIIIYRDKKQSDKKGWGNGTQAIPVEYISFTI